jgi:RNA polymerase sigma-70 factor (ECF subfamily)
MLVDMQASATALREPAARDVERRVRGLFDAHFDVVWRTVRRLGLPDAAADDAAQEVFVIAAKKLASLEAGRERSFLVGTAIRVAANVRRQRRDVGLDEASVDVPSREPLPDEIVDARRSVALLDRALVGLPDDLRTVLVLTELDALTQPEIAELTGVPLGTVASRLRRARQELAAAIATERRTS